MRGLRRAQLLVAAIILAMFVAGWFQSCKATPPGPPPADASGVASLLGTGDDASQLVDLLPPGVPKVVHRMLAPATLGEEVWAHAAVRRSSQLAEVSGGLPAVILYDRRPIAGEVWRCSWVIDYVAPREGRTNRTCVLVASQRPAAPGAIPGGAGGQLLVHPDLVLAPRPGSFLTQTDGIVQLELVWPETSVGARWFVQMLVADSRTPAGVTVSPMLELQVGTK